MDKVYAEIAFIVGVGIGNIEGDRQTYFDCASKGKAVMVSSGVIECSVHKAEAK